MQGTGKSGRPKEGGSYKRTNPAWSHSSEAPGEAKFRETEQIGGSQGLGQGDGELLLRGAEFHFGGMKRVPEMDGGGSCTTV